MLKQTRFQLSYKKKEAEYLIPIEKELMEEMHIASRSDLHKYAIRFLHQARKTSNLPFN